MYSYWKTALWLGTMITIFFTCYGDNDVEFEKTLNVTELIASKGYPFEVHEIRAESGYYTMLIRIPFGKSRSYLRRPAVFLMHGILGSAGQWVLDFPHQSLGYVLADAGYDVWMGNARGTDYSSEHDFLPPDSEAYWDFSFEEIGTEDLSASIDYILKITSQKKLFYVGHSMGITNILALLSLIPEYNSKLQSVVALAPVANLSRGGSLFISVLGNRLSTIPSAVVSKITHGRFLALAPLIRGLSQSLCGLPVFQDLCLFSIFFIEGREYQSQLNFTRLPIYIVQSSQTTSSKLVNHYLQIFRSGKFRRYDYGPKKNHIKYRSSDGVPPLYPLEKVTTPFHIFWSQHDQLADSTDVKQLANTLPNLEGFHEVKSSSEFTHFDFIAGLRARKEIYDIILSIFDGNELYESSCFNA